MSDQRKRKPLHTRILVGLAVGAGLGLLANAGLGADDPSVRWLTRNVTDPVGQLFLRLLLMVVVPLVFSSLVVGVAGIGNVRKLGRVGLKCLAYTVVLSAISVAVGLMAVNLIRPGERLSDDTAAAIEARYGTDAAARVQATAPLADVSVGTRIVETLIPSNPIAAVAAA